MSFLSSDPFLYLCGGAVLSACCFAIMRVRRHSTRDSLSFGLGMFAVIAVLTIGKFFIVG